MFISVATSKHTELSLPEGYFYVETGSAGREEHIPDIFHDNEGDNISLKNNTYCELTVLYWLWKNRTDDIKGLCHYRRLFSNDDTVRIFTIEMKDRNEIQDVILTEERIRHDLEDHDMILLMPYNPGSHTAEEDLKRYLYEKDIDLLDQLMAREFPEYLDAYLEVMHSRNLSYCNMLIAENQVFDAYCAWLFQVLSVYEKKVDLTGYDPAHQRIFGYVSEVLLNVWEKKNGLRPKYYNLLGVGDYWQKPMEKFKYSGYRMAASMMETEPGRKMYEGLFRVFGNKRYENYLLLKQKLENN